MEALVRLVGKYFPQVGDFVGDFLHKQKGKFTQHAHHQTGEAAASASGGDSWVGVVWNGFIAVMIAYFLLSIVQSVAQSEYKRGRDGGSGVGEKKTRRKSKGKTTKNV